MPSSWSNKDERMYDHIRDSEKKEGRSSERAKEIAARTVNKTRREEGRTSNTRSQGTGNPGRGYEARSRDELYNLAKERHIPGRSGMNKSELAEALRGGR